MFNIYFGIIFLGAFRMSFTTKENFKKCFVLKETSIFTFKNYVFEYLCLCCNNEHLREESYCEYSSYTIFKIAGQFTKFFPSFTDSVSHVLIRFFFQHVMYFIYFMYFKY